VSGGRLGRTPIVAQAHAPQPARLDQPDPPLAVGRRFASSSRSQEAAIPAAMTRQVAPSAGSSAQSSDTRLLALDESDHSLERRLARLSAVAKIGHEIGIAHGVSAEPGRGRLGRSKIMVDAV
jgi:hypothetical protein